MRLFATIAVLGSFVSSASLQAQSLAEHGAAAAGATIGTAAGKPISNAVTKIFGQTEEQTKSASRTGRIEKPSPAGPATSSTPAAAGAAPGPGPAFGGNDGGSAGPSEKLTSTPDGLTETAAERRRQESRRAAARLRRERESAAAIEPASALTPITPPIPLEPVVKEPTPEELATIQIGANQKDVLAALGVPASRVTVPDDDGHLRESYQYWAKGSQIGTIRLDNGVVVKVEARRF